jgi:hypothetical protein
VIRCLWQNTFANAARQGQLRKYPSWAFPPYTQRPHFGAAFSSSRWICKRAV